MTDYGLSRDVTANYEQYLREASDHYRKAEWEDMSKALEQAKECCDEPGFPDRTRRKQKVFEQYGSLMRRYGRYTNAAIVLEKALRLNQEDDDDSFEELIAAADANEASILESADDVGQLNNLERLSVLGELGTVYRHLNNPKNAARAFDFQYQLANRLVWKAEAEACRAVGNAGMVKYEAVIRDQTSPGSEELLNEAIQDIEERVRRAQALRSRLAQYRDDKEAQGLSTKAHQWESIGVVRLVLCYIAKQDPEKALDYGEWGTKLCSTLTDPTMRAHGRFYHGYALWHNNRKDEARNFFSFWSGDDDRDKCTPAIAFCKEPSEEYRRFLRFLVEAGVEMLHIDEQGYSALDYAVFADDKETAEIVISSIKGNPSEVERLKQQAVLRRYYRVILQEHFRPALGSGGGLIGVVKERYARLLDEDPEMASSFDRLKYVSYSTFKAHGRLPWYNEPGVVQEYQSDRAPSVSVAVTFVSYRWIGKPGSGNPDDSRNTQYRRMCDALEKLRKKEEIPEDRLGVWLVIMWRCIVV